MRGERDHPCGQEGAHDAEGEDGTCGAAEPARADVEAPVEEDDDERDDGDALDLFDGEELVRPRDELAEENGAGEEQRGVRQRDPIGEPHSEQGDEDGPRDDEDRRAEVTDLAHAC